MIILFILLGLFLIYFIIDTYIYHKWHKEVLNGVNKIFDNIKGWVIGLFITDNVIDDNDIDSSDPI